MDFLWKWALQYRVVTRSLHWSTGSPIVSGQHTDLVEVLLRRAPYCITILYFSCSANVVDTYSRSKPLSVYELEFEMIQIILSQGILWSRF